MKLDPNSSKNHQNTNFSEQVVFKNKNEPNDKKEMYYRMLKRCAGVLFHRKTLRVKCSCCVSVVYVSQPKKKILYYYRWWFAMSKKEQEILKKGIEREMEDTRQDVFVFASFF